MVGPLTFFDMTTTTKSDLTALNVITEPAHLASLILECFDDIKDFDPGVLSISYDFRDGDLTDRELTITWQVNGCDWNEDAYSEFLVTTRVIDYILDAAFCNHGRHPFWHLICMFLMQGEVSIRFDHLYAYAHAAHVCARNSAMFFGALDPEHPFSAYIGKMGD